MTFSVVACDLDERAWGIAVASKFPAVGAIVPWVRAEAGAVATQSLSNTSLGPRGLEMMSAGRSAQETLDRLLDDDPDRELRQVGLVDPNGGTATFTGTGCYPWAGGVCGRGYAIQGNILAGDRAGGDRRGRQSAAIYVARPGGGYGGYLDRWIDYRVDDHPDPVPRLGELLELHELYFGKSPESERLQLQGETLQKMTEVLKISGCLQNGKDFVTAFNELINNENFEERADPQAKWIDEPVLSYLLKKFEKG